MIKKLKNCVCVASFTVIPQPDNVPRCASEKEKEKKDNKREKYNHKYPGRVNRSRGGSEFIDSKHVDNLHCQCIKCKIFVV